MTVSSHTLPHMPLLRRTPLSRASAWQHLTRPFSASANRCQAHTQANSVAASASSKEAPQERYFVQRTHSQNLPVFHQAKRGGNLRQTRIQKVEGDVTALKAQLVHQLGLDPKEVVINNLTKHIIIKVTPVIILQIPANFQAK
ncbi:MAG: hypothetical protein M1817_006770 [Caeruleum heppii]|nr:MAG: hypothetical protein M1817_006770 [Caeruleum heppii]